MDGKTVRETVTSTGRELVNLKSVAKLVPVAIALGGAYGCVSPISGQQTSPEATPTANTLINVEILRTKEPTAVPNPELIVPALDFQQAATDGKLVYVKLDTNNQLVGAQTGDLGDAISGNFDTPKEIIPQSVVEQIALPSAQSVIVIKMGEKNLPIKIVRVPTTSGIDKVVLFGKFDGSWKQILLADGDQGLNISSGKDGVIVDGMNRLNLAFDSETNPTFQALLSLNNPGTTDQFFSALYPNINGGKLELVYREQGNVIKGNLPEGLFEIKNSTGATKILASMAADLATPAAPTAPSPTPTKEPSPTETPNKTVGYYFPEIKEGLPNVPIIPVEVYKKQMMRVEDVAAVRYNPDTKRVQAVNDKGILLAEAAWVEKAMDDGSKQLIWEWGAPFIKTDKGTELRGPTEEVKKESVDLFINAYQTDDKMAESVKTNLIYKEIILGKDQQRFVIAIASVPKDRIPLVGQKYLDLYQNIPLMIMENGEWKRLRLPDLGKLVDIKLATLIKGTQLNKHNKNIDDIFISDFDVLTIDSQLQWDQTEPQQGVFNFSGAQKLVEFAIRNKKLIMGNHLAWGNRDSLPDWLKKGNFNADQLLNIVKNHVSTLANHEYSIDGNNVRIPIWSTINEFDPPSIYGPGFDIFAERLDDKKYTQEIFKIARSSGVTTLLSDLRNETETKTARYNRKIIEYASGNVDGLAMHMRINAANPPKEEDLIKTMQSYGVDIYITELTVDLSGVNGSQEERYAKQAEIYKTIMTASIKSGKCRVFGVFGVGDNVNFLEEEGKKMADPTLFDDTYKPKPGYYALLQAMFEEIPIN